MKDQTIYIDLDSLLDTRVGCMSLLSNTAPMEAFGNGYFKRDTDRLWEVAKSIDEAEYLDAYANRGNEVLRNSYMTNMLMVLGDMVSKLNEEALDNPLIGECSVYVNTYPYTLLDAEKDAMSLCIGGYIGTTTPIKFGHVPTDLLSPKYIKDTWVILMMYDFIGWYTKHGKSLGETPLIDNVFFLPKLRHVTKEEVDDEITLDGIKVNVSNLRDTDPFSGITLALAGYLNFQFLEASDFSMITEA